MNKLPTEQMSPRAQRFMRELAGPGGAQARNDNQDPEVRHWQRVSAIISIGVTVCFMGMLAIIGLYAPPAAQPSSN